jgi:type I restriction enzyme, S subunit
LIVPLPRPDDQAAIARILDSVDTALERKRTAIKRACELERSVLEDAFEKLNAPRRPLRDYTTEVRYGTSKAASERGWGNPVLRIPNVVGDKLDLSDLAFVELAPADVERLRV